ncbi:MAG: ribosome silencing factor [Oscillospiraceae bacterium]|jgi:ribosome-associated protein|nr:ribosome silencing factor [Oscillospiraceae bacterium]
MLPPTEMTEIAVRALDSKKARDIKALKTHDITVLADYFIICTASSATHIKTLSDEVEKALKDRGEPPPRVEGYRSGGWVLVDFGCLVIHLFIEELREFYALERLWSDAENVDIKEWIAE